MAFGDPSLNSDPATKARAKAIADRARAGQQTEPDTTKYSQTSSMSTPKPTSVVKPPVDPSAMSGAINRRLKAKKRPESDSDYE